MRNQRNVIIFALMAASGIADTVASAQNNAKSEKMRDNQSVPAVRGDHNSIAGQRALALQYMSNLRGTNIRNSEGKTVFEIKDAIFDRHSGQIAAYIVSYDRVVWPSEVVVGTDANGKRIWRTSLTKDQLESRLKFDDDAFDPDDQNSSEVVGWWQTFGGEVNRGYDASKYSYNNERFVSGKGEEISGTVVSVDRIPGEYNAYRSVAEVRLSDGTTRKVVLGPSWYLQDQNAMPMRGQMITFNAAPVEGIDGAEWGATSYTIKGRDAVTLRQGDSYTPSWQGEKYAKTAMQRRMLLASNITGCDVRCLDETSGEVEDLVIDVAGGRVVALVIDPNENFLGMADTTRLIPVSVASASASELIFIDATKDMITKAPAAPSDLEDLGRNWQLDSIYDQRPISYR